ncbi:MAG: Trehalose-6-phosphate synthase [Actinomycetia bacterium]|nr:Trehalose-6-phosphate synthase [Actinomycetes bacterium]
MGQPRIVVATHRGPFRFTQESDGTFSAHQGAGGVVSALGPLLRDHSEEVRWVAAAITDDDRAAIHAGAAQADGVDLDLLDLDPNVHRMHYELVSNGVLWFLHHGLFDLVRRPRFDARFREAWDAYCDVNRTFATSIAAAADDDDIVLVQDYQLCMVPQYLRAERPDLRVVHFTHIPFCGPNSIRVLPDDVSRALCGSLASAPAGFHTARWGRAFEASTREVLGNDTAAPWFAASLGPDLPSLENVAASPEARASAAQLEDEVGDCFVVLRTDRVEPSKNIVRGFLAYERLLETRPDLLGRVVFVAMLYMSREGLPEYLAYGNEVEQAIARVNDRFGRDGWTPIILDLRDDFARSVAGLQRYDVLLVNPLKDGLNLVAKEGPLLNQRNGVVCLSPEAGAYDELGPAVERIHPYDIEQGAAALGTALSVTPEERAERANRLRALAGARTPADWLRDLLAHA